MDLKESLKNKPLLKESIAHYLLVSGKLDNPPKSGRGEVANAVKRFVDSKLYSMTENDIIEYFDTTSLVSQVAPTIFSNKKRNGFRVYIWCRGVEVYVTPSAFSTRGEATAHCAEKLIELSDIYLSAKND